MRLGVPRSSRSAHGYDGLFGLVREGLGRDPLPDELFLFVNARRKGCRVLV
jgi:hypothetical protein